MSKDSSRNTTLEHTVAAQFDEFMTGVSTADNLLDSASDFWTMHTDDHTDVHTDHC
jgi:hypothetical protein